MSLRWFELFVGSLLCFCWFRMWMNFCFIFWVGWVSLLWMRMCVLLIWFVFWIFIRNDWIFFCLLIVLICFCSEVIWFLRIVIWWMLICGFFGEGVFGLFCNWLDSIIFCKCWSLLYLVCVLVSWVFNLVSFFSFKGCL